MYVCVHVCPHTEGNVGEGNKDVKNDYGVLLA